MPLSPVRPIDRRRWGALRGRAFLGSARGTPGQGWPAWGRRGLWLVPVCRAGGVRSESGSLSLFIARLHSHHLSWWCGRWLTSLEWHSCDRGAPAGMLRQGSPGGPGGPPLARSSVPRFPCLFGVASAAARPAGTYAPCLWVVRGQGTPLVVSAGVGEAAGDPWTSRPAAGTGVSSTGPACCGWSGRLRFLSPACPVVPAPASTLSSLGRPLAGGGRGASAPSPVAASWSALGLLGSGGMLFRLLPASCYYLLQQHNLP